MSSCAPSNAFLKAIALLNVGSNHGTDFLLIELDKVGSLHQDLEAYFDSLIPPSAREANAKDWGIEVEECLGKWEDVIRPGAQKWFFDGRFSPRADQHKADSVIDTFIDLLRQDTKAEWLYRLSITPPVFYQILWDDYVLESGQQRWILHFGLSD